MNSRQRLVAERIRVLPPGATEITRQEFATRWLCEELDAALDRIAKLEALNPECRDVVGTTASGQTVHGLGARYPREPEE